MRRALYEATFGLTGLIAASLDADDPMPILGIVPSLSGRSARPTGERPRRSTVRAPLPGPDGAGGPPVRDGGGRRGRERDDRRGALGREPCPRDRRRCDLVRPVPLLTRGLGLNGSCMFPTGVGISALTCRSRRSARGSAGRTGLQVVLHAGNIGMKQGLARSSTPHGWPPDAATRSGSCSPAAEVRQARSEAAPTDLPNVEFLGLQPDRMHASLLAAADVLLLSERASQVDMSLPEQAHRVLRRRSPDRRGRRRSRAAPRRRSSDQGQGSWSPPASRMRLLDALAQLRDEA